MWTAWHAPRWRWLKDPEAYRHLGQAGERLIRERYSMETIIPRMTEFYEAGLMAASGAPRETGRPANTLGELCAAWALSAWLKQPPAARRRLEHHLAQAAARWRYSTCFSRRKSQRYKLRASDLTPASY